MNTNNFIVRYTFFLLSLILTIYAIIVARDFLYPITLGALGSYLLFPFINFLEKKHIPRILAILFNLLLIIIIIYILASFVYKRLDNLVSTLPELKRQALFNIDTLLEKIESNFNIRNGIIENFVKSRVAFAFESGEDLFNRVFTATTDTLFTLLLLPVYIFLFLFYRTKFANFILKIVPEDKKFITVKILRDISRIAPKYLAGVMMVGIILACINSIGLLYFGVKFAIILGIISGLLAFIPYFGSILGGITIFIFTLLTAENPVISFKIGIFSIIIVFIEHNILTPNIVGNNLRINPFVIILSLIIAGSIWGIPGLLVIVPFMAIVKIITKHYPGLNSYSYLLGMRGTRKHAVHFPTIKELLYKKKYLNNDDE